MNDEESGPRFLARVVRSLQPRIESEGIATAAEIDLDTLQSRISADLADMKAVLIPPTLVGAWGSVL